MPNDTPSAESPCDLEGTCYCPPSGVVTILGRKYAIPIVSIIGGHRSVRSTDVHAHLPGASSSTVSKRLRELEEAGIVSRTRHKDMPPRVEYDLSRVGVEVYNRLEPLLEWAERQA